MKVAIEKIMERHKDFFASGKTLNIEHRKAALTKLFSALKKYEPKIIEALKKDMRRPEFDALAEIYTVYDEINFVLKKLKNWMKPEKVRSPLVFAPSKSYIYKEPYGTTLIIAPWNYPIALLLNPLVGAISAGNCAVLKPSNHAPHTESVIKEMIEEFFTGDTISIVTGDRNVIQELLEQKFDYIFFTGGPKVGRIIMSSATKNLTPLTLELGGKSPCVVDKTARLEKTAKKIVWGKFFNVGQTCTAPDYVLVSETVKDKLIENIQNHIAKSFGKNIKENPDYGRVINKKHFDRLVNLLKTTTKPTVGGEYDETENYIAPTIIENPDATDPIMQEEIFGPLLPILTYKNIDGAISFIRDRHKPLALYVYSEDNSVKKRFRQETSSGALVFNDNVIHYWAIDLPFGGVEESGMGKYHGKYSFDTFSNKKSIIDKSMAFDITHRYPPHNIPLRVSRKLLGWFGRL